MLSKMPFQLTRHHLQATVLAESGTILKEMFCSHVVLEALFAPIHSVANRTSMEILFSTAVSFDFLKCFKKTKKKQIKAFAQQQDMVTN